jgi:hypothetical protein
LEIGLGQPKQAQRFGERTHNHQLAIADIRSLTHALTPSLLSPRIFFVAPNASSGDGIRRGWLRRFAFDFDRHYGPADRLGSNEARHF